MVTNLANFFRILLIFKKNLINFSTFTETQVTQSL